MHELILEVKQYIENNLENTITLDSLASSFAYSKHHFSRLFKQEVGVTFKTYLNDRRLTCAAIDIISGSKIIDVAMKYGYETQTGFTKAFVKKFKCTPKLLKSVCMIHVLYSGEKGYHMTEKELHDQLRNSLASHTREKGLKLFDKTYDFISVQFSEHKRYSGEAYITHPLNVALILENIGVDFDTIIMALLHDVYQDKANIRKESLYFLSEEMIHKLNNYYDFNIKTILTEELDSDTESIILVKLADRLHNLKTLRHVSPIKWAEKIEETYNNYLPLASLLKNEHLKNELDKVLKEYKNEHA